MGFYHCANIPAVPVPLHSPGSASRFRGFQLRLTFPAVPVPLHSPGSASRFRGFQLRLTFQAVSVPAITTPPHSPGNHNSASRSKQSQSRHSQLCLTTQAVTVPAFCLPAQAVSVPPHSTIQIKYSFPSSLIFCRDFWILMRILSGTPAILFSICSATIS